MEKRIICEYRTYTENMRTHDHDHMQLILPLQGALNIKTDFKELSLDENKLFLLPTSCQHSFWARDKNEFLVLDIPSYLFKDGDLDLFKGGKKYDMDERWKAIRFLLLEESGDSSTNSTKISFLFHYFYPLLTKDKTPISAQYIQQHFNEEINLEMLAALEHYTVGYYCSWFKGIMNYTPMDYLIRIRIERAKQLLLGTGLNITQIAWEVGYSHQSSLTRIFKKVEGITPADYRRNVKIS